MNIGFDLDEIFVGHPPFIPGWLIQKLYREDYNGILYYRIPGKLEQKIRQLSHLSLFRPPLTKNITYLKKLSKNSSYHLILVSSRFGFLKRQTRRILSITGLDVLFEKLFFNYKNEQPHVFKSKIIDREHIEKYIDDDLPLLLFLSKKNPETMFFWLNQTKKGKLRKNLYAITAIKEFLT